MTILYIYILMIFLVVYLAKSHMAIAKMFKENVHQRIIKRLKKKS